ncbi:hypothetical protein WN48_08701 [Eufriesea mexicana]|nr:hypothetical protein WN48_08701 [Eufriesea mexicana]
MDNNKPSLLCSTSDEISTKRHVFARHAETSKASLDSIRASCRPPDYANSSRVPRRENA